MPALSFEPMKAGINNQKLALLGLVARCMNENAQLQVPDIVDFVPGNDHQSTKLFEDVFDIVSFEEFLRTVGVGLTKSAEKIDSWQSFVNGTRFVDKLRTRDLNALDVICKFFNHLTPKNRDEIQERVPTESIDVTVQLRVEQDWVDYYESRIHTYIVPGESMILDPFRILQNVKQECGQQSRLYACIDRRGTSIALDDLKRSVQQSLGLEILTKEDFFGDVVCSVNTNLYNSIIDFDVASRSNIFVGTSRSTFSNVSNLTAEASRISNRFDYIYNLSEDTIIRRTDLGTKADPREAVSANLIEWFRSSV